MVTMLQVKSRFLVELSTDIAATEEEIASSIKKGVDEFVTMFSTVTTLRSNEVVGDLKEYQSALQIANLETQKRLTELRVMLTERGAAHEEALVILGEVAAATQSKKLRKFVKRSRKLFESPKDPQTPD